MNFINHDLPLTNLSRNLILSLLVLSFISCTNENSCEEIMETYEDGTVKLIHKYSDCSQKTNYERIHHFPNGQMSSIGNFKNTFKEVEFKTWYPNGQLSAIWENKKGKSQGKFVCYREDGTLLRDGTADGEPFKGYFKLYDETGKLQSEGYLENDSTKVGKWTEYYPNGEIEYIWNYENRERNGICSTFYDNGVLESIMNMKNDEVNDTLIIYDSQGKILFEKDKSKNRK